MLQKTPRRRIRLLTIPAGETFPFPLKTAAPQGAAEREKLGKKNGEDEPTGGSGGTTASKTVSTTDPDSMGCGV